MAGFTRDLKRLRTAAGCHFEHPGKGDHEIWFSPLTKVRFTVDADIKRATRHSHDTQTQVERTRARKVQGFPIQSDT